jgi:radical SAM superfamily enzyme YgiQ (UPF0313 family)
MRRIINKKINEQQILSAASRLVKGGIINLRLYFLIGLPFETDADAHAIVDPDKIQSKLFFLTESRKKKKMGTITLSINPFIPKPATPFQWSAMAPDSILKKKNKDPSPRPEKGQPTSSSMLNHFAKPKCMPCSPGEINEFRICLNRRFSWAGHAS